MKPASSWTVDDMLTSLQNLRTLNASAGTMTLSNAPKLETRVRLSAGASAEEAKAYGIVDHVVQSTREAQSLAVPSAA